MVSIIIPYIDEHDYLADALASASGQQGVDVEIILVCNAPTVPEGYNPIPDEFKGVVFIHEPRSGSAHARNAGLHAAKGEWIQFLDVDDLLLANKIKTQLQYPQADVVVSPHIYIFLNGKQTPSAWAPEDIWSALLSSQLGSTSSMLWRKNALEKTGGWNATYESNQEYELIFRMLKAGFKIQACAENLTIVRERMSGSITKSTKRKPNIGIELREEIWKYLAEQKLSTPGRYLAFQKYVFKNLRALYILDPKLARKMHTQYFSGTSFMPTVGGVRLYPILYSLFGFDLTERMMAFYRYIRKHFIKSLPVNT
ncbi:MAG TPA: glycosyltransferase family A protein [Saprospiraceae bacterium]|nr:glycosyltransferase family A protein [Saprospiraceae bacterium]